MIYIALVVVVIIVLKNNSDYKKEVERLKKIINEKELKYNTNTIKNLDSNTKENRSYTESEKNGANRDTIKIVEKENRTINEATLNKMQKEKKSDEGVKNKFILMTGAVLIVLAAIVFLTSTWYTIPNIIKTIVIVLLGGVFMGASNIAKKVFKLEETANTFLYISLAYLPIALFSIALFSLLGEYLSIYGEGHNLYFATSSICVAIVYLFVGNKRKQKVLFNSSMVMQLLSVIFITQCVNTDLGTIGFGIIVYNILITFIKKDYFKDYIKEVNIYNKIYLYSSIVIEVLVLFRDAYLLDIITNILIFYNLYLNYKNNKSYKNIFLTIIQILVLSISLLNFNKNIWDISIREIIFFELLIVIYIKGALSKNIKWKESSIFISIFVMTLFYISTFFFKEKMLILKNYIIIWTITILNIISYIILGTKRKKTLINIIPICLFIAEIHTIVEYNLNVNYMVYISLAVFVFSIFNIIKDEELKQILQVYANIMIIISFCASSSINAGIFLDNTIMFVLLMIVYLLAYIKNKTKEIYKIVAYMILNVITYSLLHKYNLVEYNHYILFITTTIISLIELYFKKLQTDTSVGYVILSYIISFIILNFNINIGSFLCIIISSICFELYIKNKNIDKNIKIIPFLALMPSVYFSKCAYIGEINFMIIIGFMLLTLLTMLSIKQEKTSIYTNISIIYLYMQIFIFNFNIYIKLAVVLIWAILHLIEMEKEKNKFKLVIFISCLILYNNIIKDISTKVIDINSMTAFKYFGYIVTSILITRSILKEKYKNGYKTMEYLILSVIYLHAISNYNSQSDAMIFVAMLVIITIFSYTKKLGPTFFTTTIVILLNAFLLTREFWFSIPWWVYMLLVGGFLITFAINNELNENKKRELIKSKMREFKDYIDM